MKRCDNTPSFNISTNELINSYIDDRDKYPRSETNKKKGSDNEAEKEERKEKEGESECSQY